MKKPAKSNMYLDAKIAALEPFDQAIDGDVDASCCVVTYGEASEQVKSALTAASQGLSLGEPVFVDASLLRTPRDAFRVIEGIDSKALILADVLAVSMASQAYRCAIEPNAAGHLLGRSFAAFESFEEDLATMSLKQRDWALLKTLK